VSHTETTPAAQGDSAKLPDAFVQEGDDEHAIVLVANRKARRVLNRHFEGGPPTWLEVAGEFGVKSPACRAIEIEKGPVVAAMLVALHRAGLSSHYWCEDCQHMHRVDDQAAEMFWALALEGSDAALPAHGTLQ
jgi:hypothetical protein